MNSEKIKYLHTLGPTGTNCEKAAYEWFMSRGLKGEVVLYNTLEEAVGAMPRVPGHALLTCVVYPRLHEIVFSNLSWLKLHDSFISKTDEMVLARRAEFKAVPKLVASHIAPRGLISRDTTYVDADSNSAAADICLGGGSDACITTKTAAQRRRLFLDQNFGAIDMGFCVHRVDDEQDVEGRIVEPAQD